MGLLYCLYYARSAVLGSSMVEHLTVNQGVAGSSPARGAIVVPAIRTSRGYERLPGSPGSRRRWKAPLGAHYAAGLSSLRPSSASGPVSSEISQPQDGQTIASAASRRAEELEFATGGFRTPVEPTGECLRNTHTNRRVLCEPGRRPAILVVPECSSCLECGSSDHNFLMTAMTLPAIRGSRVKMGSMRSFSGCNRTWSASR